VRCLMRIATYGCLRADANVGQLLLECFHIGRQLLVRDMESRTARDNYGGRCGVLGEGIGQSGRSHGSGMSKDKG
jgi:hypothetical protein